MTRAALLVPAFVLVLVAATATTAGTTAQPEPAVPHECTPAPVSPLEAGVDHLVWRTASEGRPPTETIERFAGYLFVTYTALGNRTAAGHAVVRDADRRDPDRDCLDTRVERRVGTDPLDFDSDGDGTLDGEESYRTTLRDPSGVRVVLVSPPPFRPVTTRGVSRGPAQERFAVAPIVRVTVPDHADRARAFLPVDDDVSLSRDHAVYVWRPEGDRPWHAVETTRHANGTASAAIPPGTTYVSVFDREAWENATTATVRVE